MVAIMMRRDNLISAKLLGHCRSDKREAGVAESNGPPRQQPRTRHPSRGTVRPGALGPEGPGASAAPQPGRGELVGHLHANSCSPKNVKVGHWGLEQDGCQPPPGRRVF